MTGLLARIGVLLLVALAAGFLAPAAGAAPAQSQAPDDSIGVRLLDAPADRRDDPRARLYIVDHLPPGRTIERRIEVSNTGADAVEVQLYPAGARLEQGSFVFADGRDGNDLTDWTTIDPPVVTVPADGTAQATVRIAVPADASEGERYGVLWAELPPAGGGNVAAINRVGIRMYVSIGSGGEPPADFTISALVPGRTTEGAPQLVATVTNSGGRALDLSGTLMLSSGPGGISAGPFNAEGGTTLGAGDAGEVSFILDPQLPAGPWQAQVTLLSGRAQESASADISFPAQGAGPSAALDRPAAFWITLASALVLLAVTVALVVRRRRRAAAGST